MDGIDEKLEQLITDSEETDLPAGGNGEPEGQAPVSSEQPESNSSQEPETKDQDSETVTESTDIPYTPEEIKALGIEKLDPSKLPEELVPFYRSMQSDYTRKMQSIAEHETKLRENTRTTENPSRPEQDPKQFVQRLAEAAKTRACSALGVTVDKFDEFDPQHQMAFSMAANEIQRQLSEEQARQSTQTAARETFDSVVSEYAEKEPNFDRINSWAMGWAEQLPVTKYDKVIHDIQSGDPARIRGVIEEVKGAWYEAHRPKVPNPPKVESSGVASPPSAKKTISGKEFGSLPEDEQIALLAQYLEG